MADPTPAKALLLALTRCDRLSSEQQQHLHAIGNTISNPNGIGQVNDQIRDFVHQDPQLKTYYTEAYDYLQAAYQAQERAKSFDLAVAPDWDFTPVHLLKTFKASDSIAAARQVVHSLKRPVVGSLGNRGDRLIIFLLGGAFLGGAIGQLSGLMLVGTILGFILAGCFSWYANLSSTL
jgi:hypothetical protein